MRRRLILAEDVRAGMVLDIQGLGVVRVRHVSPPAPGFEAWDLHLDAVDGRPLPMGGMYGVWAGRALVQVVGEAGEGGA